VALGDAAEWFPLVTDRTIAVGPWGVEWKTPDKYRRQLGLFWFLSTCHDEECLSAVMDRRNVQPDYLYVPKGGYTVRGFEQDQPAKMRASLQESNEYRLVYENEGVMVFEVLDRRNVGEQASVDSPGFTPVSATARALGPPRSGPPTGTTLAGSLAR